MDRLTMQDVDGDGEEEPVLLFQEGAYRYLVCPRWFRHSGGPLNCRRLLVAPGEFEVA